ncbi:class I SAM-dependent methyltransferase [Halochromatium glycolicum]|uniref:SAM-dependent methyltransferase n=1 Tax=Halochromatium glycolicum TaxID=85075 RepID=A0AAJ0U2B4_9GAMM|nr:class I SAM-dependent methyltransferase [Halochromatium glycolicum]MBK1703991.1 SAM-dependent methyltransferase [Halochromatium glycolicum]
MAVGSLASDLRVLLAMLRGQPRTGSHAERLQAFYAPQAERYDAFRARLLHGRAELIAQLGVPAGAHVVELGAGTGQNLLFFDERLAALGRADLVDLCPALIAAARRRTAAMANVRVHEADACHWQPEQSVDAVYLAYALTMIPDWAAAIENAIRMLRPGGVLGVVDFYVSASAPEAGQVRHSALTRAFWPRWFRHDGVHLDPQRLQRLRERLPQHQLVEQMAPVPYLPGLRVPYYRFVGRKPG